LRRCFWPGRRVAFDDFRAYTVNVAKLLLLFTVVPLVELYLLLQIDELIGLLPTVAIVLTTGVVGAWLARSEGLRVLSLWQRSVVRGAVPDEGVLGGVLILIGGALLVTPGVLTDIVGFAFLIPPSRRFIADRVRKRLEQKVHDGSVRVVNVGDSRGFDMSTTMPHWSQPRDVVMDVEAEAIDADEDEEDVSDRRTLH
jgi:UPF0716 protein FxsA